MVIGCSRQLANHNLWLCGFTVSWNKPREELGNVLWGVLSCHLVMSVCLPVNVSYVDRQITFLYSIITTAPTQPIGVCTRFYFA